MLERLVVRNFRSLDELDLTLEPLTALVGPNGAGKSAVLEAVDLLIGDRWPSMRSLRIPEDWTLFETSRDLVIQTWFGPALEYEDAMGGVKEVHGFEFSCKPYKKRTKRAEPGDLHDDNRLLDATGELVMGCVRGPRKGKPPEFGPLSFNGRIRDQGRALFIDARRDVVRHLPGRRNAALARLLAPARKEFERGDTPAAVDFKEQYERAMETLRTPRVQEVEGVIEQTAKRMLGFLGSATVRDLHVGFGFADPANPFSSLRIQCREGGLGLPAELMGQGVQSALVVGIFEALRQLGEHDVGTILLEEPEMYLHPQAQRYFYGVLKQLVDEQDAQVIYTTHSTTFADMARFESVRLLRRLPAGPTHATWVRQRADGDFLERQRESEKLGQYFDPTGSELLFARRVLLVEGHGDQLAARRVAESLGVDVDAEDLAIVSSGGKNRLPFFARACRALEIPFVVLHDLDILPIDEVEEMEPRTQEEGTTSRRQRDNERAAKANLAIGEAAGDTNVVYSLSPSLEAALGISRNADNKPRRIVETLQQLDPSDYPEPLTAAVRALAEM